MQFIDPRLKPTYRLASYYDPQLQVKVKDGVIVRRTHGGNLSDFFRGSAFFFFFLKSTEG